MEQNELTLREIQNGAYEVLKKIASVCDSHGWIYFLTYGSLIGAVRHEGIIPWDDDIDIMMPRPDYEKLKEYFIQHSEAVWPLKLFDKSTVQEYPHMISRISDMRYHVIFDNERDYGIGLFVDIYPLDGVGDDLKYATKLLRKTKRLASLCFLTSRKRYGIDNTESKRKMLFKFPAYCWSKIMGNSHYINRLNDIAQQFDYKKSQYVACVCWPVGKKYGRERDVFPKDIFQTMEMKFEDNIMKIPVGYDEFLRITYGDYMKPPSEKGKKVHHAYHAYVRSKLS